MTDPGWIEGVDLEALLPHRGVNLLIDAVRLAGGGGAGEGGPGTSASSVEASGEGRLRIPSDDPHGRDIFLREGEPGGAGDVVGKVLMEAALAEHLALGTSCVLAHELAPGEIALFSRISKFELEREPVAGEQLLSEVKRLRDKGNFRRFDGAIRGEGGDTVATAEIMAYAGDPRETAKRESAKLAASPEVKETRPIDRGPFAWKRPEMVFVDELVDLAEDGERATFRYTYPPGHPFCPGHFPGNPIMMGITQWIAACDAAAWLVHQRPSAEDAGGDAPSSQRFRAEAEILRESGALVAEVRGLVFSSGGRQGRGIPPVRVESTQRVGFRGLVRAGETIFVRVRVAPC